MPRIPTATGLAGIQAIWEGTYKPLVGADGLIAFPEISETCLLIPSTVSQEIGAALSPAPGLVLSIGELVLSAVAAGKLELVAKLFDAALQFPRDDFMDDRIGLHNARIREMAVKGTYHWHELQAATLEANPTAIDANVLFKTSRSNSIIGTFNNALVPAMAGTAPTAAEFMEAVKAAQIAIKKFTDAKSGKINIAPQFGLLVPTDLEFVARACALNELIGAAGAQVTNEVRGTFTPYVQPFLSSAVTAFMYVKNGGAKPLVAQDREAISTESLGEGSDEWVKHDRAIFRARARRVMAAGHPGMIARMVFTHT